MRIPMGGAHEIHRIPAVPGRDGADDPAASGRDRIARPARPATRRASAGHDGFVRGPLPRELARGVGPPSLDEFLPRPGDTAPGRTTRKPAGAGYSGSWARR